MKEQIIDAFSSSLYLKQTSSQTNYKDYYGTETASVNMLLDIDDYSSEQIDCKPETQGSQIGLLKFTGPIMSNNKNEEYDPEITFTKVA